MGRIIPYIMENKINVPNHQPVIIWGATINPIFHITDTGRILTMACLSHLAFKASFRLLWDCIYHWPSQEPKFEVPTIYKAYFSGLGKGISPQKKGQTYGTFTYLHQWDPEIPID